MPECLPCEWQRGLLRQACGFHSRLGAKQAGGDSTFGALQTGFNDWVKTTLNEKHQSRRYSADDHWADVILAEAGNDSDAFKLFYELWESFSQTQTA